MLFLLPNLAWLILAVELFERFAYYGAVFTFTTFTLVMLDSSVPLSNAVVNVVFILSPLAAVAASCVADGPWGRPRTLARSALVYSLGLCLVFASALPAMYASFPDGPTWYARALFGVGLVALGLGYGGVKTCSAPLLGEVLADHYRRATEETLHLSHAGTSNDIRDGFTYDDDDDDDDDDASSGHTAVAALAAPLPPSAPSGAGLSYEHLVARGYGVYFFVMNLGGLLGTLSSPLRGVVGPTSHDSDGDEVTTGYYLVYGACAAAVSAGAVGLLLTCHWFQALGTPCTSADGEKPPQKENEVLLLLRTAWFLLRRRCACAVVALRGRHSTSDREQADSNADAPLLPETATVQADSSDDPDNGDWVPPAELQADVRQALSAVKFFAVLPFYWIVIVQSVTNITVQAGAVERPAYFPPEIYNNVSTVALLLLLPVANWVARRVWGDRPPYKGRMLVGIAAAVLEIAYSAAVQVLIDRRGTLDAKGNFTPHAGQTALSGWILIPTYVLNGAASAFVDPTSLEAAFVLAPARTKSFVMALYLFASSSVGFLGLALSPVAVPANFIPMFLTMGGVLTVSAVVWARFAPS